MMKAIKNIFIGLILGGVIGWALGFLRLPYLEKNYSFFIGFVACLAVVATALISLFLLKKNLQIISWMKKNSAEQNLNNAHRKYILTWSVVAVLILAGGLLISILIYIENKTIESTAQKQNKKIREQSELFASSRRSSMTILLNEILNKVDDDLKNNADGKLSEKTIASIVDAFNYSFAPYRYWEGDSLSKKKLSPEKGQLLLALFRRNIDSNSFNKIKRSAHFAGADLSKGDLHGIDLSGADLKDADLSRADLSGAIFQGADLRNANMWGAHANKSNFIAADLRRAIMNWAEVNDAQLDSANLNGADLSNAQLRKADLHKATFRASKLDGALLIEANLESVSLIDASMQRVNLSNANMSKSDVNRANFDEAIMAETVLGGIINVDKDWFEKLKEWQIVQAKKIIKNYKVEVYTVIDDVPWYRLERF